MQQESEAADGGSLREMGDFFREKRRSLSPERYGFTTTRRRLSPGLSRYEVASLADIGSSWYARLEAGRVLHPTPATIAAVARALQLTPSETDYVFTLAGLPRPANGSSPANPSSLTDE